ncbi:type II toxin-antitoxin system prevent-host-death family antitoxin [Tsukamurella sp. 8F]|uniref:type II toxin-antitoxin system Phd/YefM family antitoxin n=1 Tax=unclassified Tsukamurella TaxID=2633480 RepID=UPI0023B94F5A|nr:MULTISPECIES: type II toxin-antitoxin system prevent-host-death family antitoxin [unclassified Tsukamurella]MDF0528658.1 type II toxin-antitoxin system prevent-host-death family antitoxin [Tsukamurella sp. 8J]MDF0585620.1 type II toxin-antitoxin system prevent-host-death family antitoxin [Tsukamurella sp. 8F]
MESIGVRELRQHASKYLARVEAGEELEVTNHGRLVARLVPVAATARSRQTLIEAGILTAAKASSRDLASLRPRALRSTKRGLSAVLDDMRNEQ